jgi:hypothetical protein
MLMVSLMAVAIMVIQGSVAASVSLNTIMTSVKSRSAADVVSIAEAGVQEAKARLAGISSTNSKFAGDASASLLFVSSTPVSNWSSYLLTSTSWNLNKDPEYTSGYTSGYLNYIPTLGSLTATGISANALQTALPYWVKMRHKREWDAEVLGHTMAILHYQDGDGSTAVHTKASPGNVLFYGYPTATTFKPVEFTTSGSTSYPVVEIVRSYAQKGTVSKSIEVELAREVGPPILAPVYSRGNVVWNGGSSTSGTNTCLGFGSFVDIPGDRPPMYVKNPGTVSGTAPAYSGTPATAQSGTTDIDILGWIGRLRNNEVRVDTDQNNTNYGSFLNYVTVYSNTSSPENVNGLRLHNVTGYGLLLVEGDLIIKGDTTWNGLILVSGTLTFDNNAGEARIDGAILAGSINTLDDNPQIKYESCEIARALGKKPMRVIRYRNL